MLIMVKVVQYDQTNVLKKFSFSYHVPILTYDVIQPSICRFSVIFDLISCFVALTWFLSNVDYGKKYDHGKSKSCSAWSENILKNFLFLYRVSFLTYDNIWPSFYRISVIFWLNLLFRHLKLIFKQYWSWYKLFSIRKTFWKNFSVISCPDFDIWCHTAVVLPFFSTSLT